VLCYNTADIPDRGSTVVKVLCYNTADIPDRGSTVVKVLCYKSEGRWFDPSWCHWNFSLI